MGDADYAWLDNCHSGNNFSHRFAKEINRLGNREESAEIWCFLPNWHSPAYSSFDNIGSPTLNLILFTFLL